MSGDENKLKKYRFPETLTNQSRWFGLPLDELIPAAICVGWGIRDNEGRVFARQGEVMNPLQYVPFNQTLYFINGDDPAQVAWMKRQTPPTLESKIILVQGSIPEMQKSLDSRVYFDQNGVLCQRLGIDQVPARVSAVPGDRFLKVEFIPAEEGRK